MVQIVADGAPVVFRGMATRLWSGFREALGAERFLRQFGNTNVGWRARSVSHKLCFFVTKILRNNVAGKNE